jgi:type I restriction enzyme S subunit
MDNEAMRDSGVEWIGATPISWQVKRIKRFATIKRGASPRPIDDTKYFDDNGEFAWVRIADVSASGRYLEQTTQILSDLGASLSVKQYPNDLIISIAGTVGKPIITKIKCCIHDGFIWFENPIFNKDYLYYIFLSEQPYRGLGKLGTQLNLNTDTIGKIFIPAPSISEQQAIAQYLDQRCGKLDAIITIKQRQIKTLDALRQSIIYQAVTKGLDTSAPLVDSGVEWLGMVPREWKVTRAKLVASIFIPQRNKPELNDDFGIPWVTMENMDQPVISKTVNFVTVEAQQEAGSRILPKLSVIASCVGTFGVASINEIDVIINQQLQAYIPLRIDAHYLRYLITISNQYFDQVSSQTTIVYVNGEKFGNLPVLLPSRREQSEIVGFLSKETQRLDQLKTNLNQQIATLEALKKSLIYECVTGKKRIALNQQADEIALA